MSLVKTSLAVRFAETDKMGVAHHSAYVIWCEVARVDWMKAHGTSYREFEEKTGVSLAVNELNVRYRQAVYFDDELTLTSQLSEAKSRRIKFDYAIYRDKTLIATAHTLHTPTNQQGQAVRMPQAWLESLAKHVSI